MMGGVMIDGAGRRVVAIIGTGVAVGRGVDAGLGIGAGVVWTGVDFSSGTGVGIGVKEALAKLVSGSVGSGRKGAGRGFVRAAVMSGLRVGVGVAELPGAVTAVSKGEDFCPIHMAHVAMTKTKARPAVTSNAR